MPSWKKVLVSGSNAHLNHVTSSGNFSGSYTSTGSFGHVMQDGKGLPPQFTTGGSIFVGKNAGANDDGSDNRNIGIGKNALDAVTTGQLNIAIGDDALTDVETGNYNVAIGFESQKDTTGNQNTSVGYNSLEFNTTGQNNVAIGYGAAGGASFAGDSNIAIGYAPFANNTSGDYNIAIGHNTLSANTTGEDNLAIGDFALATTKTRSRNVALGSEALRYIGDGGNAYNNVAVGWNAGRNYTGNLGLVTASYSVFLGHTTKALENNSVNEIVIGSQLTGHGSNTATIGDAGITDVYFSSGSTATLHTGNVSGSSTSTGSFGHVHIGDGLAGLGIGNDNDLLLYHDGSHSYIKDSGTGNLYYRGGTQTIQNGAGTKTMAVFNAANSVDLNYNNNTKFQTTNTGVSITGNVIATGTLRTNSGATMTGSLYVSGSVGGDAGAISASGDIVADGDIIAYNASDRNLKDNLQVIEGSLDKIGEINGYEFDWNEKSPGWARERGHDVGVVAQEIQKVLPEIVTERKNGYLGVDYKRIVPLLIESIKELKEEVEELKKKVN